MERHTVRDLSTVLHRRRRRTHLLEGCPDCIQRRTLGSFVKEILQAGLQIESLVETPLNAALATESHADPARWYSVSRVAVMPTTFIVKARKRLDP